MPTQTNLQLVHSSVKVTKILLFFSQPIGFMEVPIPYSQIENVYSVSRWDSSQKFYIRIVISDGSVLLQVSHFYNWWFELNYVNNLTLYLVKLSNLSASKQMGPRSMAQLNQLEGNFTRLN